MAPLQPLAIYPKIRIKQLSRAHGNTLVESPETAAPHEYHARVSHRKTRTGCRVCKIRRIKCDETKPDCNRCTSTGRKCEGYPVLSPSRGNSGSPPTHHQAHGGETLCSLSLYHLSSEIPGNEIERRSFHYLRERAIYDISGYFESEFWDRLVLQISHTEPSVRHALLALSSLCEKYESRDLMDNNSQFRVQFALQHYNKAVRLVAEYMSTLQPRLDVILTSCLVFAWLEIMRNDFDAGLRHLNSGIKIIDDFRQSNKPSSLRSQHVDVSLIYLFSRLKTQATVFRRQTSEPVLEDHEEMRTTVPASFSSIEQARNSLHTLLDTGFRFVRQIGNPNILELTTSPELQPDLLSLGATRRSCLNSFQNWQRSIANSPASIFQPLNPRQTAAMCLLHMYHKTLTIFLETLFTRSQMIYDQYDSSFYEVIILAEQLINNNSQNMSLNIFFDMGVMAPLYYVIIKCRNLAIRRKALSLLKQSPYREGMWIRPDVIQHAEWWMCIEERARGELPETEALPEEARIWNEQMKEVFIDGRPRTVVGFQWRSNGHIEYGEEITDLSMGMGQLL